MRCLLVAPWILACSAASPATRPPTPESPAVTPAEPWALPAGFRSETIPFPLEFAPALAHRGVEELRFAPGFFDPAAPGYWSYAFVWRTEDAAALDAAGIAGELTGYFRGLIAAVDEAKQITGLDRVVVRATGAGPRWTLTAHVIDAFKTKQPLELAGWAERTACRDGALWRFVLAPTGSALRPALDGLASAAACGQPLPPPRAPSPAGAGSGG